MYTDHGTEHHDPGAELLPLFPPIEPFASGMLDLDAPHRMYYEQSGNPRGVPVVFLHGGPGAGASAVHRQFFDPGVLSHRRLRPARRGTLDAAGLPREQHHAAADRGPGAAAHAPRHRALARLRRLVGLDARARLRRAPSRALPGRSCCAASSSAARARSTGSSTGCARSSRRRGARSRATSPRPSAATCSTAYYKRLDASRSRGAHAGGAQLERLRGLVLDAAAQPGAGGRLRLRPRGARASRASRRTTSATTSSCRRISCSTNVGAPEGDPGRDRAGPLRHRVPAGLRRRPAPRLAARPSTTIVADAGHSAFEPGIRSRLVAATEEFKTKL